MPVKEEEIRIGNWFKEIDGFWSYRKDDLIRWRPNFQWGWYDWYALKEGLIDLDFIEPIPISSEILEASGFEKDNMWWGDGKNYYNLNLNGFDDIKSIDVLICEEEGITVWLGQQEIKSAKYIHSMQNLCYSLTGQELNIVFP